ncbi:hypothetical protein GXW84_24130 [Rhodococcus sp. IEGM 248]|uniref:hypothetical protein n=1 Tax=Rhodococcus opacus TaxID=37919 RepID=UPI0013C12191|nr:hypothetical protein [Rhodococcus opacus]MDV7086990.1 hypothetical protein [Rhodococcus opacus]NDV07567.1 hypothetical protein [Rhodococcus sp. IEGM 248]
MQRIRPVFAVVGSLGALVYRTQLDRRGSSRRLGRRGARKPRRRREFDALYFRHLPPIVSETDEDASPPDHTADVEDWVCEGHAEA